MSLRLCAVVVCGHVERLRFFGRGMHLCFPDLRVCWGMFAVLMPCLSSWVPFFLLLPLPTPSHWLRPEMCSAVYFDRQS